MRCRPTGSNAYQWNADAAGTGIKTVAATGMVQVGMLGNVLIKIVNDDDTSSDDTLHDLGTVAVENMNVDSTLLQGATSKDWVPFRVTRGTIGRGRQEITGPSHAGPRRQTAAEVQAQKNHTDGAGTGAAACRPLKGDAAIFLHAGESPGAVEHKCDSDLHPPRETKQGLQVGRSARPKALSRMALEQLLACVHRGAELRQEPCETCSAGARIKIVACEILGECQLDDKIVGVKFCGACGEFSAPPFGPVKGANNPSSNVS